MQGYDTSKTLLMLVREQGDEASWQRFSETYRPFIFALMRQQGISHEDCEELSQDVLVKVWKALGDFLYERSRCRFRTWLARISKNTAINFHHSKSNRQNRQKLHYSDSELLKLSCQPAVEEAEEAEWKLFIAGKAWKNIQSHFSELHLRAYSLMLEGKSAAETAKVCDVKENTAYVYRKKVQTAMGLEIQRLNSELDG